MCEQEKKRQRLYDLLNAESFFVYRIQNKEKDLFKKKWEEEDWTKKRKEGFLTALDTAIEKDPHNISKKACYWIESPRKTVRTAIKQDLNPDHNPLDYAI